jgi:hypothetical protein
MNFEKDALPKIQQYARELRLSFIPVSKYKYRIEVGDDYIQLSSAMTCYRKDAEYSHYGLKAVIEEMQKMYLDNKHVVR